MTVSRTTPAVAGDPTGTVPTPLYDALVREYRHALRAIPGDRTNEPPAAPATVPATMPTEDGYRRPALARWPHARRTATSAGGPKPPRMFAPAAE
jgi:hypothetical protein